MLVHAAIWRLAVAVMTLSAFTDAISRLFTI
jgi:hypothetical protein